MTLISRSDDRRQEYRPRAGSPPASCVDAFHFHAREGLERILGHSGDLETLRWELVHALRDGSLSLDRPGLADHLRQTVVTQVAIDQPQYSGYRMAFGRD